MKYKCLLRPHANGRYQAGAMPLALAEIKLLLAKCGRQVEPEIVHQQGFDWITFECDALDEQAGRHIYCGAHIYLISQILDGELLKPLTSYENSYLGDDLPYILKYKGKTNETFTRFLINVAFCSSAFSLDEPLKLLDPMCGRGTTIFEAVNRGWNAMGVDVQSADVEEASKFFKRYLEHNRFKHTFSKKSMTAKGKEAAVIQTFEFAKEASAFKAGDTRTLSFTSIDSSRLGVLGMKQQYHLIATDLPYGVQHAPGGQKGKSLQQMVKDVLPSWRDALLPGGAMALAFNTNTLKLDFVREAMEEAGLRVMSGAGYDGLAHWVEQAITRDIAVAVRV